MTDVDAPGTCHLVGCPDKGQHAPHGIGAPDTFAPYDAPATAPAGVIVSRQILIRADSLLSALVHGRVAPTHYISDCDRDEARILSAALREATGAGCG